MTYPKVWMSPAAKLAEPPAWKVRSVWANFAPMAGLTSTAAVAPDDARKRAVHVVVRRDERVARAHAGPGVSEEFRHGIFGAGACGYSGRIK